MAKEFWNSYLLVGEISKNDKGDVIRVAETEKNNKKFVDVRTYYKDKDTGELLPGKGISIPDDLADEVALAIIGEDSTDSGDEESDS